MEPFPWDPITDSAFKRELSIVEFGASSSDPNGDRISTTDPNEANAIGSLIPDPDGTGLAEAMFNGPFHAPVIDLDIEAHLIPSSTPGHSHLYLEVAIPHDKFMAMLDAMVDAGVVEPGYRDAARRRGQTHVRKPGVLKVAA